MEKKNISFEINCEWKNEVRWDRRQMKQVFINILINAIDAIGKEGKISIITNKLSQQEILVMIKDNGPGMPDKILENIFNLYYTTKAKGTGIGLSIVQRIVYEHHGNITVESKKGEGTTFLLKMPVSVNT